MIHTVWATRNTYSYRVLRITNEMFVVKTFWFKRRALKFIADNDGNYSADGSTDWRLFIR